MESFMGMRLVSTESNTARGTAPESGSTPDISTNFERYSMPAEVKWDYYAFSMLISFMRIRGLNYFTARKATLKYYLKRGVQLI
jgi:hypothetical protein